MGTTSIEWTRGEDGIKGKVWNPVTGCSKVSEGCRNCYAERMAKRLAGRYGYPKNEPFTITQHYNRLGQPVRWKEPKRIFVSSMGDLFHEKVTDIFIMSVFVTIADNPRHKYLILTKRPQRMKEWMDRFYPDGSPDSCWLGVSIENQKTADERIPILLQIPAKVRFVSIEPMLGPVDLCNLTNYVRGNDEPIDWVIVGGESGPNARPMHPDWVRKIRDDCKEWGVPFFFKQWGEWMPKRLYWPRTARAIKGWGTLDIEGNWFPNTTPWNGREGEDSESREYVMYKVGKKAAGRELDGRIWEEWPNA